MRKTLNAANIKYLWSRIKATFATSDEVSSKCGAVTSGLTTQLNNHTGNTSNPHNVTKAQIGLGEFDYEEGTWAPINGGPSNSNPGDMDTSVYKFKNSKYRKIGNVVILTTTATPTNSLEATANLVIRIDSLPFKCKILSASSVNNNGSAASIGKKNLPKSTIDFGSYSFIGNSSGLTDVDVTIICSL